MRKFASVLLAASAAASALLAEDPSSGKSAFEHGGAYVTAAEGQVTIERNARPWAVSTGDGVPVRKLITTGPDGFAHLEVVGGNSFDVYANSRVIFRENAAAEGDLLDVLSGRVRVHLNAAPGRWQERVFSPIATITAIDTTTIAVAVDEDENVRIDVLEGEVRVQHKILPRSEPTLVKAVDAILVEKDKQISRQLDRGTLYRYAIKPLHDLFTALTPGRAVKGSPFGCVAGGI